MITIGIDIGSRNTKLVAYDSASNEIIFADYISTEIRPLDSVNNLFDRYLSKHNSSKHSVCVTGYGRHLYVDADLCLSEISCHAAGVRYYYPECRTIIDIGGQDSKVITLDECGKVLDFVMNDKCAAGTGRFLEMTTLRLNCSVDDLSGIASDSDQLLRLNSTCVVFAESEIIGMMATSTSRPNIVRAVHNSITKRIISQINLLSHCPLYVFTGGVALNDDLLYCLSRDLKDIVQRPNNPEITGALGAAILASKHIKD